jgi:hypothetical protein
MNADKISTIGANPANVGDGPVSYPCSSVFICG